MFYSASTSGFYVTEIHGDNMPADVVEITDEQHSALMSGQAAGKVIVADAQGRPVLQDPPPLTYAQEFELFRAAIQQHLDAAAVEAGYYDIKTAVTYADEPAVPKFQLEGQAFRAWRSLCWEYGYTQLDAVEAGQRPKPTVAALIAELPTLALPA